MDKKQKHTEEKEVTEREQQLSQYVWELIQINDELTEQMELQNQSYAKLKMQFSYLQAQNQRYHRTMNRVTGTWYGKGLLKVYCFLKKIGIM